MKAAVLYEPKTPFVIEELELDEPSHGEVMVRMVASGVCHSDWHVVKGEWVHMPLPAVLGHEGAGMIEAVGPGNDRGRAARHLCDTPVGLVCCMGFYRSDAYVCAGLSIKWPGSAL